MLAVGLHAWFKIPVVKNVTISNQKPGGLIKANEINNGVANPLWCGFRDHPNANECAGMDLYHNKDVESLQKNSFYGEEVARPGFFMTLNKFRPAETGSVALLAHTLRHDEQSVI